MGHHSRCGPRLVDDLAGVRVDLRLQRLDLRELFHRVVFNNLDPNNAAPYGLSAPSAGTVSIPGGQWREGWYLETTPVRLHFADGALQAEEFVREDVSYVFENGRWSRYTNYGPRPLLSGFGLLAEQFRQCPLPPGNKFGSNPQAVIEEVFTYFYTYGTWATGNPPTTQSFDPGGSNNSQQVPSYQNLLDAQKRLEIISYNLIN